MGVIRGRAALSGAVALLVGLVLVAFPDASYAASTKVAVKDNRYQPKEVHVQPGDTVVWANEGRNRHTVTADHGAFDSGDMGSGDTFSHTFSEEGYYYYHCVYHGSGRKTGMWGVVVVGNPPESADPYLGVGTGRPRRPQIVVPDDFPKIQRAVDEAHPGTTILIKPGVYRQRVVVKTNDLVIRGVDRFRTVLHGQRKRANGILVDGVDRVAIRNLTVRDYTGNGIFINNSTEYLVERVDSINNRVYGIYAFDSYNGVFRDSFGWGSGDSAFYVGECMGCGALLENLHAEWNVLGYSGTNATGVIIRDSTWVNNGTGLAPNTLPTEDLGPNRGTLVYDNLIARNNNTKVRAAGFTENVGMPWGTGVWLPGVDNNVVRANVIRDHDRYGVLITQSVHGEDALPENNRVRRNRIGRAGKYALAWDGTGANNCFAGNGFKGETGPPGAQETFHCDNRPFVGVPFPPVQSDTAYAVFVQNQEREQRDPPEPKRPRCQRGAPGCDR